MSIFMFTRYVLLLTSLLSSVLALPLVSRDVVSPPITSPTAGVVWHVGQTQTVTWNTTGLPVHQSNPVGMLVLGYLYNNSENLMLNSPLATNLNYSVGQAQITVPNVPTRSDYIVVLFGDSGNASPKFTITNDPSTSASASPPSVPPGSPTPAPSTPTPSPSPGNVDSPTNSGGSSPTPASGSSTTGMASGTLTPSGKKTTQSSTVVVVVNSAIPSSTQSSAAWQNYAPSLGTLGAALTFVYVALL